MKIRIISLFLSVAFLSILTFESFSSQVIIENSSIKTIEHVLEKRLADKFMDDTHLLHSILITQYIKIDMKHQFKEIFYTFKSTNTLYRPPINS